MQEINRQEIEQDNQDMHLRRLLVEAEAQIAKGIHYIKFAPEETKTIRFEPNKTKSRQTVNYGKEQVRDRWKFYGYEVTASNDIRESKLQEWTTGPKIAIKVLNEFVVGMNTLEITRHGYDLSTTYEIRGVQ
jgi:hypothetical protein